MTWQTEGIKCPWSVVAPLCTKVNSVICAHPIETVTLFECTQMTLGIVIPAPKARTVAQDRTRKRTPEPFILRIEKFAVISDPKLVTLFDTVYAATREDKTSAEIMLDMYSDSLGAL